MENKAALVTGAADRIGRALALSLASRGYDIALHYNTSGEKAEKARGEIESFGVKCGLFQADLSNAGEVAELIDKAFAWNGRIRVLVNNASTFRRSNILATDWGFLEMNFRVNFFAPFMLSCGFAEKARKGVIVNILDSRISSDSTSYAAYMLSKKSLANFTCMAAKEFGGRIRVNAVAPGVILADKNPEMKSRKMKVEGSVEDVVSAVNHLVDKPHITGEILYVGCGKGL